MRNRKKQLLAAFVLTLTLTLCLCPAAPALAAEEDTIVSYAVTGGNIYFDPSTGEITDCDTSVTAAKIPSSIDGVAVTGIGSFAFLNCTSLTSVTIPDGVTGIGDDAFYRCTSLTSVNISGSVTSIGDCAFKGTPWLESLGEFAVVNGMLLAYQGEGGAVTIPNSVTSIGGNAFYECTSLTSVTIPDSVTRIGSDAFSGCISLTSVTIPDSVTSIGGYTFYGCTGLTSAGPIGSGCDYEFGWTETIPPSAFSGCTSLTSVTIPNSVTSIGSLAFAKCTSLTSIDIPDSVTSFGVDTFWYCTSLTNITVNEENLNYCDVDGVLFDKNQSTIICYPAGKTGPSYIIPNSVKSIGYSAFSYCTNLKSITIPNSVTSIDVFAFDNCTGLISITIPDSVTSIGDSAFFRCIGLTSIVIPDSVTSISGWAFYLCTNLTSIIIPNSVEIIGNGMFEDCTSLKSVTIPDSVTSIGDEAFYGCDSLTDVYYSGTEGEWKTVSIGSSNDLLLSATIHYNSGLVEDTPDADFTTGVKGDWDTLTGLYGRVNDLKTLLGSNMPENLETYLDNQLSPDGTGVAKALMDVVMRNAASIAEDYGVDTDALREKLAGSEYFDEILKLTTGDGEKLITLIQDAAGSL